VAQDNRPAKPEQLQLFFSSRYLNIEQVAEILGVPKSFIYRRTARGHRDPIPHYRLGGHLRFKLDDIEQWMEAHRNNPEKEPPAALVAALREKKTTVRSTKPKHRSPKPRIAT
jgi:excisionase family DNA binding protein